ncbi:MAG: hypothetical protein PVH07_10255, partial [Chloroflexota bacterium]
DRARTFFHAALAEDVRTHPSASMEDLGSARDVLLDLYQERQSALRELARRARESTTDPIELAAAFEHEQGPDLGTYDGLRAEWRDEGELAGIGTEALVFIAGTHALPHHIKSLSRAVQDAGLRPVVVMEYRSRLDDNDYSKSERFMRRCGRAVFDLSFLTGQMLELPMAVKLQVPFFAGYVAASVRAPLHGSGMVPGLLEEAGVEPEAVVDAAQLREAARAWLRSQGAQAGRSGLQYIPGPQLPEGGTAVPYLAYGSTTEFVPEPPTAVPSGEGYVALPDDPMEMARHWSERLIDRSGEQPETDAPGESDESRDC